MSRKYIQNRIGFFSYKKIYILKFIAFESQEKSITNAIEIDTK